MTLKSSYELLIKSYEQFQVFWNQVKNRPHISRAPFGVQRTIYTHDREAIVFTIKVHSVYKHHLLLEVCLKSDIFALIFVYLCKCVSIKSKSDHYFYYFLTQRRLFNFLPVIITPPYNGLQKVKVCPHFIALSFMYDQK